MSANWVKIKLDKGRMAEIVDSRLDIGEVLAIVYAQEVHDGMINRDDIADSLIKGFKEKG